MPRGMACPLLLYRLVNVQEWMKSFEELPKDRRSKVEEWFSIQAVIIESLGIPAEEWFEVVGWAIAHPLDYSFLQNLWREEGQAGAGDKPDSLSGVAQGDARKTIGDLEVRRPAKAGPSMSERAATGNRLEQELFQRFMRNTKA